MSREPYSEGARRRWSAAEKARIVRRYLDGKVTLVQLAELTGASPGQISQWCHQALDGLEWVFDRSLRQAERRLEQEVAYRDERIGELEQVVEELSEEVLRLKKPAGVR